MNIQNVSRVAPFWYMACGARGVGCAWNSAPQVYWHWMKMTTPTPPTPRNATPAGGAKRIAQT